ncbi:hypothetical protein [Sphaerisporangium sp. NPDC051011]|uniref:hypothetical protein n=1 Tax=Sphaerisporangium sp. NPDC051011 TaxID=3155792 RepID=UPI0033C5BB00
MTAEPRESGPAEPGIRRRRRGRGFSHERPGGRPVLDRRAVRIRAPVIPPALTDAPAPA